MHFLFCFLIFNIHAETITKNNELLSKLNLIPGQEGVEIRYGYELFTYTPKYFGPKGIVFKGTKSRISCSNCHLESGTRELGNSLIDTHASYPQFRSRENEIQTLSDRINACFRHPNLGTKDIPVDSREMKALQLYIKWIGRGRQILEKDLDGRLIKLEFLNRAADPILGKKIFNDKCIQCHTENGQGKLSEDKNGYIYPPLWGHESFMLGSSMSRLSILSRFIKGNMPYGTSPNAPQLSDEEAWDVAAFIMSHPRPQWVGKIPFKGSMFKTKPFDYPLAPYADNFSQSQHQLGPFKAIMENDKKQKIESTSSGI